MTEGETSISASPCTLSVKNRQRPLVLYNSGDNMIVCLKSPSAPYNLFLQLIDLHKNFMCNSFLYTVLNTFRPFLIHLPASCFHAIAFRFKWYGLHHLLPLNFVFDTTKLSFVLIRKKTMCWGIVGRVQKSVLKHSGMELSEKVNLRNFAEQTISTPTKDPDTPAEPSSIRRQLYIS